MRVYSKFWAMAVGSALLIVVGGAGVASAQGQPSSATCDGQPATIVGTAGADVLYGTPGVDVIVGLGGDDVIYGRAGDDLVCGGPGRDRIYGEAGADVVYGGDAIDYVWGGPGIDTLIGNGGSDRLRGGSGDDVIAGGSGADRLWGNEGNDEILGQGGQDEIWGGHGDDTLQGNWQSDTIWGGHGRDIIRGAGGKDVLYGGHDRDDMWGGENSDVLFGGSGWDRLYGGRGADEIWGGLGSDLLYGGPHTDICHRGADGLLSSCQQRQWELSDRWELTDFAAGTGWQPIGVEPWQVPWIELDLATQEGTLVIRGCYPTRFEFTVVESTFTTSGWSDSANCSESLAWVIDAIRQAHNVEVSGATVTFSGPSALRFARVGPDFYRPYDFQEVETALASARAQWDAAVAAEGDSYEMMYRVSCFGCNGSESIVTVQNGTASFVIDSGPYPTHTFEEQTVPTLFAIIERALADDAHRIDVTYGDFGVPERVFTDDHRLVADDRTTYTVSNFTFM